MIKKEKKADIVKAFGGKSENTGSTEVQVALLTERINEITVHLKANDKDEHSRRGLLKLVERRKSLLKYLESKDIAKYRELKTKLKIR